MLQEVEVEEQEQLEDHDVHQVMGVLAYLLQ
jgi:hypothetical protein